MQDSAASARPPIKVTATVETHMELVPIAPRTHQLDALLQVSRLWREAWIVSYVGHWPWDQCECCK